LSAIQTSFKNKALQHLTQLYKQIKKENHKYTKQTKLHTTIQTLHNFYNTLQQTKLTQLFIIVQTRYT